MRAVLRAVLLPVILSAFGNVACAQIASWNFTGSSNAVTLTSTNYSVNLSSAPILSRGPGAPASSAANSFRTTGFQNNGISTNSTDYFQTSFTAATGFKVSLASISASLAGTGSFSVSPGTTNQFAYSLDGTNFTLIGAPVVRIGSGAVGPIDTSSIGELQNVPAGTTVTLRFYATGQTTTGGWGFNSPNASTDGFSLSGVVDPASGTAPTISSFSPTIGPVGTTVTINGSNFGASPTVKFNGVTASSSSVNPAGTVITATVPAEASTGPITVEVSGEPTATSSTIYTVGVPPPSITVSPAFVSNLVGTNGAPSAASTYTVLASNLTGNLVLTTSTNGFEISTNNASFARSLELAQSSGSLSNTIYVRVAGGAAVGLVSGTVTNAIAGASVVLTNSPTLSGSMVPPPIVGNIYWDFNSATPASGVPVGWSVQALTRGNNMATNALFEAVSQSTGYVNPFGVPASSSNNAAVGAIGGVLNIATNAYFEVNIVPPDGSSSITNISFGTRSTSSGPLAYVIRSSADGFSGDLASGTISNSPTVAWSMKVNAPVSIALSNGTNTLRIYGYNGTNVTGVSANWRIDDLTLAVGTSGPSVSASPSSLTLPPTAQLTPGASTNFTASGSNLSNNITVSVPGPNFAISTNNTDFTNTLTLQTNALGSVTSAPVYVRLTGASPGTFTTNVALVSGTNSNSVTVTGTVAPPAGPTINTSTNTLAGFAATNGFVSTNQSFTASGTNLTGNLNISASPGYEISTNGTDFVSFLALVPTGGASVVTNLASDNASNYGGTTSTNTAITYVGSEAGNAVTNWSNPNVAKAYGTGGSQVYGTGGYYQIRPTPNSAPTEVSEPAADGNNLGITAGSNPTLFSAPSFATSTGKAGTFVNFGPYPIFRGPNGSALYRQGALSVSVNNGPFNSPAGNNASFFGEALQFTVTSPGSYRVGLVLDAVADAAFAPNYVGLYNPVIGQTVFSTALVRDGTPDMVFFDVTAKAGDTFTVGLWQNTGTQSVAALSMVTFDNLAGWTNGANGGTGFGAWSLAVSNNPPAYYGGVFIGNPTAAGIVTNASFGTNAFGMYANPGGTPASATADRTFAALQTGQTFSFQWAINWDSDVGNKGFRIYSGGTLGTELLNVNQGGFPGDISFVSGGVTNTNIGLTYGQQAMTWSFAMTSSTNLLVTSTPRSGATSIAFSTNIIVTGAPDSFRWYASAMGPGDQRQQYYNNLKIEGTTTTGGAVAPTPIFVRIASNAPITNNLSGSITLSSAGASANTVTLSGSVTGVPALNASPTDLPPFVAPPLGASPTNSFLLTGNYLTSNVTVTAPAPFRVSTNSGSGYTNLLSLAQSSGRLSNTIFVQIDTTSVTNVVTNILVAGGGAAAVNVGVQATVADGPQIFPPTPASLTNFFTVVGNSSPSQSYAYSASSLSNVAITNTVPPGYEISTNNIDFASAVTNRPPNNGVVSFTNFVRIAASAAVTESLTGAVAINAAGVTGGALNLTGTVAPFPSIGVVPADWSNIWTVAGFASSSKAVNLTVSNLVATNRSVGVSAGAGAFQVSTNSTANFASSLVITGASSSLTNFPVFARLSNAIAGTFSTNVSVSVPATNSVTNVAIPASGTALPRPAITAVPTSVSGISAVSGYASTATNFTVSGTNLLQGIRVALATNSPFEISTNGTNGFTSTVNLEPLLVAADGAANYTNGWTNGANAGTGFGPWVISSPAGAIATITNPASSGVAMAAPAFAIGGTNGAYADAIRPFAQPLAVGERFSVHWGNNWDSGGSGNKGLNILTGGVSGTELLNINMGGDAVIAINGQPMFTNYGTNAITLNFQYVATNTLFVYAVGRDGVETYQDTFTVAGAPDAVKFYAGALTTDGFTNRLAFFDRMLIAAAATNGGGVISGVPVYLRLKAGLPVGSTNGIASIASGQFALPSTVTFSGTVDPAPSISVAPTQLSGFETTEGLASASQSFEVSGQNFRGEPVTLVAPSGYELARAADGPYASQVEIGPFTGSFTGQTMHARISRQAPQGPRTGDIELTSPLATAVKLGVDGMVLAPVDPGQNDEFVRIAGRMIFYTDLTDTQVEDVLDLLGWSAGGQATAAQKAQAIAELSGFDASLGIFDWNNDYARISAAFAPFARLGLVPTTQQVEAFLATMGPLYSGTLLPFPSIFNGLPDAPWWATRELARAMRDFMQTPQFTAKFPGVAGLDTRNFYNWMRDVMFPGRAMGSQGPAELTRLINDLTLSDGQAFAQGAGVAFRSVYVSVLLTEARGSADGSNIEKPFQRRANLAALNFQLWNNWSYSDNSAEYSVANVANLLRSPVIAPPFGPVVVQAGAAFGPDEIGVTLPAAPINQQLLFTASLDGFAALPDWLEFNRGTGEIQGTVPVGVAPGIYTLRVTAENMAGVSAPQSFQIQVLPPSVGPAPENLWLQSQGVGSTMNEAGHLDPDGDGFSIKQEYLFGLGVHVPDAAAFARSVFGDNLVMEWSTPSSGVWHQVQRSTNLQTWLDFTDVAPVETGSNQTHTHWQLTVPRHGPQEFFRIISGVDPKLSP